MTAAEQTEVWGPYVAYDDVARFTYGRRFWRLPDMRRRLLAQPEIIEEILSTDGSQISLDRRLREQGASLRSVAREIPPVFGTFF